MADLLAGAILMAAIIATFWSDGGAGRDRVIGKNGSED